MYSFWQDNDFYKGWKESQDNKEVRSKKSNKQDMKSSEEIKGEIKKLEQQYTKAVLDESKTLVWSDKTSWDECDMIGFHNMTKGRKLLELLYEGKNLFIEHEGVGNHLVYMNPQRNCYTVYKIHHRDGLIEVIDRKDSLLYKGRVDWFLFSTSGTWYEVTDDFIKNLKK